LLRDPVLIPSDGKKWIAAKPNREMARRTIDRQRVKIIVKSTKVDN